MARKDITRNFFNQINRELKKGDTNINIAKKLHISTETVRTVRNAKTWSGFVALKASRRNKVNAKASKVPAPVRAASSKNTDDKFQTQLNAVPNDPVTPAYVQELLSAMEDQRLSNENLIKRFDEHESFIEHIDAKITARINVFERYLQRIKRIWWSRR